MNRFYPAIACLGILLIRFPAADSAFALDPAQAVTRYGHDVWDGRRGFPYFAIHAIRQDRDGYLWLATDEGIVRFDGIQFTLFDKSNTPAITVNDFSSVAEDSAGTLWFGSRGGGLCRWSGGGFTPVTVAGGLPGNIVQSLLLDSRSRLLIGIESFGIGELSGNGFVRHPLEGISSVRTVYCMAEARDGTVWFGVGGLGRRLPSSDKFEMFPRQQVGFVKAILEDRTGTCWIGSDVGLYTVEGEQTRPCLEPGAPASMAVTCLLEDRAGNLWIGTEGHGLYRRTGGVFSRLTMKEGLSSDRILSLAEDGDGNLWIGTRGGGLNRLRDRSIRTLSAEDGLAGEYITAVYEDSGGSTWIGIRDHGVDELRGDSLVRHFGWGNGSGGPAVRAIAEGPENTILLGTSDGIYALSPGSSGGRFTRWTSASPGLQPVRALRPVSGGLLIGFYGNGLWRSSPAGFSGLLPDVYVRAIDTGPDGSVWVGAKGAAYRIRGATVEKFSPAQGLSHDEVFSLHIDPDSTVWIGTYGGGLNRLKRGVIVPITRKDGLFDDVIYAILDDDRGNFWMSSNRGIFRVRKMDLEQFADGRIPAVTSVPFGTEDGMKNVECNGGSQPSAFRRRDGKLLFPTVAGLVIVDPARVDQRPAQSFPVHIECMLADDDTLDLRTGPSLRPGNRKVEFQYSAIDLHSPEKLRFRYVLNGFDERWWDAGVRRKAYYTNLPPGEYTFRVNVSDEKGAWQAQSASVTFSIPPFLWQRWWFRLAAITLSAAALLMLVRRRERQIKREANRAMRIRQELVELESRALRAQMNPHFLFNALNSIQECVITDKTEAACEYLSKFARLLRLILENSEAEFVPVDRELEGLRLYLELESLRFDHGLEYRIEVDPAIDRVHTLMPPMLIQPYVENALWHGLAQKQGDRRVSVTIRRDDASLICTIEDNGIGRSRAAALRSVHNPEHESKGMRVTRERLDLLIPPEGHEAEHVTVSDLSGPGGEATGTRVELHIPRSPEAHA